jgi:Cu+-exporting ATPase
MPLSTVPIKIQPLATSSIATTDTSGAAEAVCYHCGDPVGPSGVHADGKSFCCNGCKVVYEVLQKNDLCTYYPLDSTPGHAPLIHASGQFAFLDDETIARQLLTFRAGDRAGVTLLVPGMHCASCVWLLEQLYTIDPGIVDSRVDFLKKQVAVQFDTTRTSLRAVVELFASLGYEPEINLGSLEQKAESSATRSLVAKVGVAGFCFGNIMMLSFPEYFATSDIDEGMRRVFDWVMLGLSLPVFFYSAGEYFTSAWGGLRRGIINIDVPLALGIFILFTRSVVDVTVIGRAGYFDSLAGLVFFLLIGKVFQSKTYDRLNFDRKYTSYFPLAVTLRKRGEERSVPVTTLAVGDKILIRHNEIIPCDAIVMNGTAYIDYSFVTGESTPVTMEPGSFVYAGGRQSGGVIELEVRKEVSQSHLTQLWNRHDAEPWAQAGRGHDEKSRLLTLSNQVGKWFTSGVLVVAGAAAAWWLLGQAPLVALDAVTGILIVACPCAFALAAPFTYGAVQRLFGRHRFYLKNATVVEAMSRTTTVVFDKTGTLTHGRDRMVQFLGEPLTDEHRSLIATLARASTHPLSRAIERYLAGARTGTLKDLEEAPGLGIRGLVDGVEVRLGSRSFAGIEHHQAVDEASDASLVHVAIAGLAIGSFAVRQQYRDGLEEVIRATGGLRRLALLSGDHHGERARLEAMFPQAAEMRFDQSPFDKRDFIEQLQSRGEAVMMVGDGLNDAGALRRANVGIAVTDDVNAFSPACDAILEGDSLRHLPAFLRLSRRSVQIILFSFFVSFMYNVAALSVAVQGTLSPVLAAILMPVSSVTVVALSMGLVRLASRREGLA